VALATLATPVATWLVGSIRFS